MKVTPTRNIPQIVIDEDEQQRKLRKINEQMHKMLFKMAMKEEGDENSMSGRYRSSDNPSSRRAYNTKSPEMLVEEAKVKTTTRSVEQSSVSSSDGKVVTLQFPRQVMKRQPQRKTSNTSANKKINFVPVMQSIKRMQVSHSKAKQKQQDKQTPGASGLSFLQDSIISNEGVRQMNQTALQVNRKKIARHDDRNQNSKTQNSKRGSQTGSSSLERIAESCTPKLEESPNTKSRAIQRTIQTSMGMHDVPPLITRTMKLKPTQKQVPQDLNFKKSPDGSLDARISLKDKPFTPNLLDSRLTSYYNTKPNSPQQSMLHKSIDMPLVSVQKSIEVNMIKSKFDRLRMSNQNQNYYLENDKSQLASPERLSSKIARFQNKKKMNPLILNNSLKPRQHEALHQILMAQKSATNQASKQSSRLEVISHASRKSTGKTLNELLQVSHKVEDKKSMLSSPKSISGENSNIGLKHGMVPRLFSPQNNGRKLVPFKPTNQTENSSSRPMSTSMMSRKFNTSEMKQQVFDSDTMHHLAENSTFSQQNSASAQVSPRMQNIITTQKASFINQFSDQQSQKAQRKFKIKRDNVKLFEPKLDHIAEVQERPEKNERLDKKVFLELMAKLDTFIKENNIQTSVDWIQKLKNYIERTSDQSEKFRKIKRETKRVNSFYDAGSIEAQMQNIAQREEKAQRREYLNANFILLEMQKNIHETGFRQQMINADDKTKCFFNELLMNFNEAAAHTSKKSRLEEFDRAGVSIIDIKNYFGLTFKEVKGKNNSKEMIIGDVKYGPNCYELLQKLKMAVIRLVHMEKRLERNKLTYDMDDFLGFSLKGGQPISRPDTPGLESDDSYSYSTDEKLRRSAIEKFQNCVAKNFLSVSLDKLWKKKNIGGIKLSHRFEILNLKKIIMKLLPEGECTSIGSKYTQCGLNQFKNDYLRELIEIKPEFNDYLRVYAGDMDVRTNKISKVDNDHGRKDEQNLNKVFFKQTNKRLFFETIKNQQISPDTTDEQKKAFMVYYESAGKERTVVNPGLIQFWNRVKYLFDERISFEQAQAMRIYMEKTKKIQHCQLRELIIDSCQMTDDVFDQLLSGAIAQRTKKPVNATSPAINALIGKFLQEKQQGNDFTNERQYLYNIVYSNNTIGMKSIEKIVNLSPDLIELKLNNVCKGLKGALYISELMDKLNHAARATYLMKLALNNISLSEPKLIQNLIIVLDGKKHLQFLDLSWAGLKPKDLEEISNTMKYMYKQIRDINFSYNVLHFNEDNPKDQNHIHSVNTVENFKTLFQRCKILNHVNFSGMRINGNRLIEFCQVIVKSPLVMGIHLNDNGINDDLDSLVQVLNVFDLTLDDIPFQRVEQITNKAEMFDKNSPYYKTQRKPVNINARLQHFMRFKGFAKKTKSQSLRGKYERQTTMDQKEMEISEKQVNRNRHQFKEYLILANEFKNYERQKAYNMSKNLKGIGRFDDSQTDQFTITRILNHPELMFNQRPDFDHDPRKRYFYVDANAAWQFSLGTECFICNKYQYTQIHYERGILAQNQDLVEVTDQKIVSELRYQYKKDFTTYRTQTPFIMGTVVKKSARQEQFERRLKMLRTPIYSLLSICQCKEFFKEQDIIMPLKDAVIQYLKRDYFQLFETLNIKHKFKGWQHVLSDMANHNELTDVRAINMPDVSAYNVGCQDWYTFGAFLQPGYHQVLIYDPKIDRAFCKEFVAKLNQRDFVYPEYPVHLEIFDDERIPDIWKPWRDDTPRHLKESFAIDTRLKQFSYERLQEKVLKDDQDMITVIQYLSENFETIVLYQKHLLSTGCPKYPQISFDDLIQQVDRVQSMQHLEKKPHLMRAQVELCFQSACLSDGVQGLKGAMQRAELMNYLIRACQQWVRMQYPAKTRVCDHLRTFFIEYIDPITNNSPIIEHRKAIRQSKRLNELLHHNMKNLKSIFETCVKKLDKQGGDRCTFKAAKDFMNIFVEKKVLQLDHITIDKMFVGSMMTILNEEMNQSKYSHMVFIEWLEFVCRAAINGFNDDEFHEPLAFKVQYLLEHVWIYMYEKGHWPKGTCEFKPIDQTYMKF